MVIVKEPSAVETVALENPPASLTMTTITPLNPGSPASAFMFVFASHRIRPVTTSARAGNRRTRQQRQRSPGEKLLVIQYSMPAAVERQLALMPKEGQDCGRRGTTLAGYYKLCRRAIKFCDVCRGE